MKLNLETWHSYSEAIAAPAEPTEYSPAAIERFMHDMSSYIVDIKGVHPQFHALNNIKMINFRTQEDREFYNQAYERFLAEKAKIENRDDGGGAGFQILVELLKFRQAAEEIKCEDICDAMYDAVTNHNQAALAALNFKFSIAKCVKILHEKYKVPRSQISLIWGGGNTAMSQKKKEKLILKQKFEQSSKLREMLAEIDMDLEDLGLDNLTEAKKVVIDDTLNLGPQDAKERQKEIDKFQKGKSLYCFFTFKSGGVGLSLHHSDELTKEKVRRKENGFAFVEDIPLIPVRQRCSFLATTYSAIELVQGLGRAPRLTSLSHTPQTILFYRGTIEERVAWIVSVKLKCLRKVVQQKEDWDDVILGESNHQKDEEEGARIINQIEDGKGTININESEDDELINDNTESEEE